MSAWLRKRSDITGAAVVEFAVLLPLLVLLVFGIVEFSLMYNRAQGLHAAAREGARIASFARPADAVVSAIEGTLPPTIALDDIEIAINNSQVDASTPRTWCMPGAGIDQTVRVDLTVSDEQYRPRVPFFEIGDWFSIDADATFRCEVVN